MKECAMPIRKDETGKRWVEMELLVPGTPEQVWQAMATGPGYAGWFVKSEIEPRVGGSLVFDFGEGATSPGEVTAFEPPHRFAYVERDWEKGAPPVATEITITARSGQRCVVRMVHSLFTSSDAWDDQVEGFESGWPSFFAVLRVYLAHFAGAPAACFMAMRPSNADALATWLRLGEALGLSGASVGERRQLTGGPERCSGIVEHVYQDSAQRYLLLRLDEPSAGVIVMGTHDKGASSHPAAGEGKSSVGMCRYFYRTDPEARRAEAEPRWREWLGQTFGS
jgi:uncharacterized protein YndB with AHSA1/START domain